MFTYCTQVLHLAEHVAFNRIEAARAVRRFPIILELLSDGRIHLSAVRLLAPHLTEANCESVLREASHKSKREIEQIVARLLPRPDAPSMVRRLPQKAAAAENTAPTCAIDSAADRLDAKPDSCRGADSAIKDGGTRPGAIQSAVHSWRRDVRQAPPGAGSSRSSSSKWRSCCDFRSRVDAAPHRSREVEACGNEAAAYLVIISKVFATRSIPRSAYGVGTRRGALSI